MNRYNRVHAEINLDAVLYNMESMHQVIADNTKIMAVIKADGYGHGAVAIAKAIDDLPYLYGYAVASLEEGLILRRNGITKPVLILGYVFPDQYEELIRPISVQRYSRLRWQKAFLWQPRPVSATAGSILRWIPE